MGFLVSRYIGTTETQTGPAYSLSTGERAGGNVAVVDDLRRSETARGKAGQNVKKK